MSFVQELGKTQLAQKKTHDRPDPETRFADTGGAAVLVTLIRSCLKPGGRDEYAALLDRMSELARTMPGYISHKGFAADDGERVTVVEFEHAEGLNAWRRHPEHIAAQRLGRQRFYQEYHVQVCSLDRESKFKAGNGSPAASPSRQRIVE